MEHFYIYAEIFEPLLLLNLKINAKYQVFHNFIILSFVNFKGKTFLFGASGGPVERCPADGEDSPLEAPRWDENRGISPQMESGSGSLLSALMASEGAPGSSEGFQGGFQSFSADGYFCFSARGCCCV